MLEGERTIRQRVWVILECAPYEKRRCLMWGGNAFLSNVLYVDLRCDLL